MSFTRTCAKAFAGATLALAVSAAIAQNAAVVNNKPITKAKVDEFVAALAAQGRPDSAELRAAVRDELIARELFVQEAEKKGLARNAEVQRQLDNARQEILIRAVIRGSQQGKAQCGQGQQFGCSHGFSPEVRPIKRGAVPGSGPCARHARRVAGWLVPRRQRPG